MPLERTLTHRDATLRPRRWPVWPTGRSALRWTMVAALLMLALGTLHLRQPPPSCPGPTAASPSSRASAGVAPPGTVSSTGGTPGATPASADGAPGGPGTPLPVPAGAVGVPIRLAEPATLAAARPGSRVDLLALPAGDQPARAPKPTVLAARVLVLDVLEADPSDGAASAIYLALGPEQAHRAVGMPEATRFAIIVRP